MNSGKNKNKGAAIGCDLCPVEAPFPRSLLFPTRGTVGSFNRLSRPLAASAFARPRTAAREALSKRHTPPRITKLSIATPYVYNETAICITNPFHSKQGLGRKAGGAC